MNIQQYSRNISPVFSAMKPKQFNGFDYACIRKFKAPVEKFNSINDFNKWIMERFSSIQTFEYRARDDEITIQRHSMIKEWAAYLLKNITLPSACLITLYAVTKGLKPETDSVPPILSKDTLEETLNFINDNLKRNKEYQFDFKKLYLNRLKTSINNTKSETGWIVIRSKIHNPENFEENIRKLKILSAKTWCTKNIQAKIYLEKGDFHIYLENGKTKYCLKFEDDKITEIQNERNDTIIDYPCFKVIDEYIKCNNFSIDGYAAGKFKEAENKFNSLKEIDAELYHSIKNNNIEKIFTLLRFTPQKSEYGGISIEKYKQPSKYFSFLDLGINEDKLLMNVEEIRGDAIFENSSATSLGNVKYIGGDFDARNSSLTSTGKVEIVNGYINFNNSQIKSTGNLKYIGGNAYLDKSFITDLNKIESIGGSLYLNPKTKTLGNLKSIGRDVSFNVDSLSLGDLEKINGDVYIGNGIYSLGNLTEINGDLDLVDSNITTPENLQIIKGNIYINSNSKLTKENFENIITGSIIQIDSEAF